VTDIFVISRPPNLCPSEGQKHGICIQNSINLGYVLLRIAREWKAAETWFLARLFIFQSAIISQILEFIYWMVTGGSVAEWSACRTRNPAVPRSLVSAMPMFRTTMDGLHSFPGFLQQPHQIRQGWSLSGWWGSFGNGVVTMLRFFVCQGLVGTSHHLWLCINLFSGSNLGIPWVSQQWVLF